MCPKPLNRTVTIACALFCLVVGSFSAWAGPPQPPNLINPAPLIFGSPTTIDAVGIFYSFTPSATDSDGDTLTFSIANKPDWATFNPSTGTLAGTPTTAGVYSDITISVSDGNMTTPLSPFTLTVQNGGSGGGGGGGAGSGNGTMKVPVFGGIWMLFGVFAGMGLLAARNRT